MFLSWVIVEYLSVDGVTASLVVFSITCSRGVRIKPALEYSNRLMWSRVLWAKVTSGLVGNLNLVCYQISLFHGAFQFTICNGPTNALVCNKTLIQMSHIKTFKITPTCFDHQLIIIRELYDPG
jgi:hypothetical protein